MLYFHLFIFIKSYIINIIFIKSYIAKNLFLDVIYMHAMRLYSHIFNNSNTYVICFRFIFELAAWQE